MGVTSTMLIDGELIDEEEIGIEEEGKLVAFRG